jgi:hypothetical protein
MSIFKDKDFNSSNGMMTSVWGPLIWNTLHIISFNYPIIPTDQDKKNYKKFILSYKNTLPCSYCRNNFEKNLKKVNFNDKVFTNRDTFSRFIYNLHNCVNSMLGKKVNIPYEEVRERYEHFRSRCSEKERTVEMKENEKKLKKEKNCDGALYGVKSKCIIRIVPKDKDIIGFKIENKCKAKKSKKK